MRLTSKASGKSEPAEKTTGFDMSGPVDPPMEVNAEILGPEDPAGQPIVAAERCEEPPEITPMFREMATSCHRELSEALGKSLELMIQMNINRYYYALGYTSFKKYLTAEFELKHSQVHRYSTIMERIGGRALPKVAGLGPTKLFEIARLPPALLDHFRANQALPATTSGGNQTLFWSDLLRMPVHELRALVDRMSPAPAPAPVAVEPTIPAAQPPAPTTGTKGRTRDMQLYEVKAAKSFAIVFELLRDGEDWQGPTDIVVATGLTMNKVFTALQTLTLMGWVQTMGGKYHLLDDFLSKCADALGRRVERLAGAAIRNNEALSRLGGGRGGSLR